MGEDRVILRADAFDRIQQFKNGVVDRVIDKVRQIIKGRPPDAEGKIEVGLEDVNNAIEAALAEMKEEAKAAAGVGEGAKV